MDGIINLLKQRRIWVAIAPVAAMVLDAAGIPITEGMLNETGDKVLAAVMAGLALASYFKPK